MTKKNLKEALSAVDWAKNVQTFLADDMAIDCCVPINTRLAVWSQQFEAIDQGNPALTFVREMQMAGQNVVALIALAMYKSAAASMRNMSEAALYYTYFRRHPVELATLVRDSQFYISKGEILEFHRKHSVDFTKLQTRLGFVSEFEKWYSEVSAIIHGQIPGGWTDHTSIKSIKHSVATQRMALKKFAHGEEIIYRMFFSTVAREMWITFHLQLKATC